VTFRLPIGARDFFRIRGGRPFGATETGSSRFLIFDAFSCCLLLGFDRRRHGEKDQLEGQDFLPGYPDTHRGQAVIYAGLLVDAELARKDIAPEDRGSVEREMVNLLDLTSSTRLSEAGNDLLNLYAASGFERLRDAATAPSNLEDFLIDYAQLWRVRDADASA